MVRDKWNFTANPFEATLTPASFYCGQPQEEVLARLEWICKERQRFTIVVGVEGVGKSHLSTTALRRVSGLGGRNSLTLNAGVCLKEIGSHFSSKGFHWIMRVVVNRYRIGKN